MEQDESILKEFLVECAEGLGRLDQDFVILEKEPTDANLLGSIFRTIHTIKGTCGFLGLPRLENVAHATENILSLLRDRKMEVSRERITILLEAVDTLKEILAHIETTGLEPDKNYDDIREKLDALLSGQAAVPTAASTPKETAPPAQPESQKTDQTGTPQISQPTASQAAHPKGLKPDTPAGTPEAGKSLSTADSTIRVNVGLLDKLMNLVGELVLARNQITQRLRELDDTADIGTVQRMNLVTTELQDTVMKTRMQPIRNVWDKFPRVVRDLSRTKGKEVELVMEGADTELDKTLLEAIKDPLTHMVRNSVDHGIETPEVRKERGKPRNGTLLLKAFHEGGKVNIEIIDDGGGLNIEKIKNKALEKGLLTAEALARLSDREAPYLIFLPGLSTADKVTNVSGRGVGMDVVRNNIEKIGGTVELESNFGTGTRCKIKLPLTLAIIQALMVKTGRERFAIPQAGLLELVRVDEESGKRIEVIQGAEFYRLRGMLLPILRLDRLLKLSERPGSKEETASPNVNGKNIVVLEVEDHAFGLLVDEVSDSEEVVVKPLGRCLKGHVVFAGATIMGNGKVALILDVSGIAKQGGLMQASLEKQTLTSQSHVEQSSHTDNMILLIFSVSGHDRFAVPLSLVTRLEEFDLTDVERASGGEVIQYRETLLPLVHLHQIFGIEPPQQKRTLPVIVFSEGGKSVGIVVGQIVEIIEERLAVHPPTTKMTGVHGSVVVQGKSTDIINVFQVIESSIPGWFQIKQQEVDRSNVRILLVEDSEFFRRMVKQLLEMQGYEITEAVDGVNALEILSKNAFDLVMSDIEMPNMDGYELAQRIRSNPNFGHIPLLALTSKASDADRVKGMEAGFQEYTTKFDQGTIIACMHRLLSKENVHV